MESRKEKKKVLEVYKFLIHTQFDDPFGRFRNFVESRILQQHGQRESRMGFVGLHDARMENLFLLEKKKKKSGPPSNT